MEALRLRARGRGRRASVSIMGLGMGLGQAVAEAREARQIHRLGAGSFGRARSRTVDNLAGPMPRLSLPGGPPPPRARNRRASM